MFLFSVHLKTKCASALNYYTTKKNKNTTKLTNKITTKST